MASKNEEELRRLSLELRYLEQTAETLQSRMNMVNAVVTDVSYAKATLESLDQEKENAELLVPVGGNSYIMAKLNTPDKVIVGVGAGVSVEKTRDEAKEIIKKRLEDLDKTRISIQQQFNQVAQKISEDRDKFEALMAVIREGKAPPNV